MRPGAGRRAVGRPPRGPAWLWHGPACLWIGVLVGVGLVAEVADAAAQDLPLKREVSPVTTPGVCPAIGAAPVQPDDPEAEEAARLADDASRAAILGDQQGARELLEEAARLHPGSGSIAFQLARTLRELDEETEALPWLCRSLTWDPDGVDAEAARSLMGELLPGSGAPVTRLALDAFRDGLSAYDDDRFEAAVREFSRALVENPDWAQAHYNRGVSSLQAGRTGAALSDLEDYLALAPRAQDRARVQARVEELALAGPQYRASTAFFSGLVVPGMGQFYTGRPGLGSLILAGAGGAAAAGFFYREVEVQCRAVPTNGVCAPEDVAGEEERRPYLAAGLGSAAALTFLGAVHAWRRARNASNPEIAGSFVRLDERGLALRIPGGAAAAPHLREGAGRGLTPELRLEPGSSPDGSVLRSFLSVRF